MSFHTPAHKQLDPAKRPAQRVNGEVLQAPAGVALRHAANREYRVDADAVLAARHAAFWRRMDKFAAGQIG